MSQMNLFTNKTAWIIVEPGLKGTENQCVALTEQLKVEKVHTRYIQMNKPWIYLAPYVFTGRSKAYKNPEALFKGPYPDIIVASGRKAINAAMKIKKLSGGKAFLIVIQDPKLPSFMFDAVIAPQHDAISGKNVIKTIGALNRISQDFLLQNLNPAHSGLGNMPHPRVAVLIGGRTTKSEFSVSDAQALVKKLKQLKTGGAALMITTSRRTGKIQTDLIKRELGDADTEIWDGQGSNPYFDYLYHADYIIVTNDSVSMATEAIATGKPVLIANIGTQGRRIEDFHKKLRDQNRVKPFEGALKDWKTPEYDDMVTVSQKLSELYGQYLEEHAHVGNETH